MPPLTPGTISADPIRKPFMMRKEDSDHLVSSGLSCVLFVLSGVVNILNLVLNKFLNRDDLVIGTFLKSALFKFVLRVAFHSLKK